MSTTLTTLRLGPMDNLLYLVRDVASNDVAIIDPAWDPVALVSAARQLGTPSCILLTHTHPDHVNALSEVQAELGLPIFVSKDSHLWKLRPSDVNLIGEGDRLRLGETAIDVWATPGHSQCSLTYVFPDRALVGDTVFTYGCGHCRLPGADANQLYASLERLSQDLPDHLPLHPGHDYGTAPVTTIAAQRAGNPYMHCQSAAEFCELRNNRPARRMPFKAVEGIPPVDSPDW